MSHIRSFFAEQKTTHLTILAVVFILAVAVRFIGLGAQMTHVDDIGVAMSTLVQVDKTYTIDYVRSRIYDAGAEANNSPQYKFLRNLDAGEKLELLLPYFKGVMKFFIVPQSFTYAPFQFLFTPLLISHAQSYRSLVFWGRFPSFIFSILALILAAFVWIRIGGKNAFLLSISTLLLLGFSWENIIYARHMSSYAIGILAAVAIFYLFVCAIDRKKPTVGRGILFGFLLAVASNMQYQAIYFIPAFFGVWFLDMVIKKYPIKQFVWTVVSCVVCMAPTILAFIIPKAHLNGAAFAGTQYNFQIPAGSGVFGALEYALGYFIRNGFKITKFITSYLPYSSPYLNVLTVLMIALACFGFVRLFFSENGMHKRIGLFFAASLLSIVLLAIKGSVSLSPTRHSLIYLPYLVFAASYGICELYAIAQKRIRFNFELLGAILVCLLVLLPFFSHYRTMVAQRENQLSEKTMEELVARYEPAYAISDEVFMDLFFVSPFKDWRAYQPGERVYSVFENPDARNKGVYMFVSQYAITNESCDKMLASIEPKLKCETGKTLYDYYFDDDATLDIAREAQISYNKLSIKVIKI